MKTIAWAVCLLVLASCPAQVWAQGELTKEEMRIHQPVFDAMDDVLNKTLDEIEKRAKKRKEKEKDGPTLLEKESKPRLGYHVYREGSGRSHYHDGKMVRADRRASKELKALLVKLGGEPTKGPKYEWMQVPDKDARERCHWNLTTIVMRDGAAAPWVYVCELTTLKDGDVTVSVMDAERLGTLTKAVFDD